MADPRNVRQLFGLPQPFNGEERRLDVIIELLADVRDLLAPVHLEPFIGEPETVELREPSTPPASHLSGPTGSKPKRARS